MNTQESSQAYGGVTVELMGATRQDSGGSGWNIRNLPVYQTVTDPVSGVFRFTFPTAATGRNGGEGLLNGGSLKLRFIVGGKTLFEMPTVKLVKEIVGFPSEYSFNWTWKISYGVEDNGLAKFFLENREVNLVKVGAFVLETGRDLSITTSTDPIPYVDDMAGLAAANNASPAPTRNRTPLSVVRATQSLGQVELDIWSIKESDDSFCYLQLAGSTWHRWPDRQPFVSIYRLDAATSNSNLFRPENQRRLHLDPVANTFDRSITTTTRKN